MVSVYLPYFYYRVVFDPFLMVSVYPPLLNIPQYASYPQPGIVDIATHLANGWVELGLFDP